MSEKVQGPTIEELLARLSEITDRMEKEQLPLSEMMDLFKEGKRIEKEAKKMLDLTEKEIRILSAGEDEGEESHEL